jgi:pimeloyl-ACP methyl ester carboxylesterase
LALPCDKAKSFGEPIMADLDPLKTAVLPTGIRARHVAGINGLTMHVLEAGFETPGRPAVLLLHGFPELAFSWRKVMLPLAEAGFHVIAPDQRGYGRTTGWDSDYDGDLASFRLLNLARDMVALVAALGRRSVIAVVGHDFGSPVAAWCALTRPEVFRSVVLMSAPFTGPPVLVPKVGGRSAVPSEADVIAALGKLARPRKHYQWYYSTRQADADMRDPPQGLHDFLRAYYHMKSGDWPGNRPFPLGRFSAEELAKLPTYYVMDRDRTMPETVAPEMPAADAITECRWLTDGELTVYTEEYRRTGFQGGLKWYRCRTTGLFDAEMRQYSCRAIEVPAMFIAGAQDWGIHQSPGALERMRHSACIRMNDLHLVDGAGHWVQQERPKRVTALLLEFLQGMTDVQV